MPDSEVDQNLGACAVFTQVHWKPEFFVCFDCVEPLFLKLVGVDLGRKADPASLLSHIDKDTRTGFVDVLEGGLQLIAAIASL